ncbi:MAG TPA: metalloregulator ArsR/SmtB family transcription factor [Planctomycetota bacterium]|nr:metalloregulator ArsR/SmtB family transcription factor [Planctomycetota bacterium]
MPRLATTADVFSAVAEPRRRRILGLLADGERPVNDIVRRLRIPQPQVSKHLGVLRAVDLVTVRGDGQQRLYSLNAIRLRPIHDWVAGFERLWNERFDRLASCLDDLQKKEPPRES